MSAKKDEGIVEVIFAAESARLGVRADSIGHDESPACAETESLQNNTCNNNSNNTNRQDINLEPSNTESRVYQVQQGDSVAEEGNIDLADPENVIHMLETVDLTEEDTEILLQEAYSMNKKLKKILRSQEMADTMSKKAKNKSLKKSPSSGQENTRSSNTASRRTHEGGTFSAQRPLTLPPITSDGEPANVYAVNLKRTQTTLPDTKKLATDSASMRLGSSKTAGRQGADAHRVLRKASGRKPEWNDRFTSS